jgi:MFS superfamily sulfate permease-like transporter
MRPSASSARRGRKLLSSTLSQRALDITGGEVFARLVKSLQEAGIHVAIASADEASIEFAERGGLLEAIGRDNVYLTIDEAIEGLKSAMNTQKKSKIQLE